MDEVVGVRVRDGLGEFRRRGERQRTVNGVAVSIERARHDRGLVHRFLERLANVEFGDSGRLAVGWIEVKDGLVKSPRRSHRKVVLRVKSSHVRSGRSEEAGVWEE